MMKVLGSAIIAWMAACGGSASSDSMAQAAPVQQREAVSQGLQSSRRTAITEAAAKVAAAVVTVQTETVERVPQDVFEQFFGGRSGQRVSPGLGSGFITRTNGVILTNAHVVSGATKVSVMLRDGMTYPAKVLGVDEQNDLAVLKIDARNLPTAPLGNSDSLLIGEWALAIGNPYGFVLGNTEPSVTAGVISAIGRNLIGQVEGGGVYLDMIQTDASINPGNSGGPLVNALGEVIGVNSSIYTPSGGSIGLGFAIPINRARRVADDLIDHGEIRRPWVGEKLRVSTSDNPRDVVTAGVVVRSVVPGSPGDKAGLEPGDQIVKAGGRTLRNVFEWEAQRLNLRVGETVPLVVKRNGREVTLDVTVADLPEVSAPKVTVLRELQIVTVTPAIRQERQLRANRGALVVSVTDRVRDEIGLQEGDVIVQINQVEITAASDVSRALETSRGRAAIRMLFERGGLFYTTDFVIR
ncbi:MAG: trypsin-like peptidase domain-containing protein [Gemmatimonadaceae bacterium]